MYEQGHGILSNIDFIYQVQFYNDKSNLITNNKNQQFYNIPAAFDIEVSSFYDNGEKRACMYLWNLGIGNVVTNGRTWESFLKVLKAVRKVLGISSTRRLYVYVHNLPYEFQFIRKRLSWGKVFLLDERKPVTADNDGIEFRCSLKLSGGRPLVAVGKELQKYHVEKLVGKLDYNLLRTPLTPLTADELAYGENDVRVLLSYIQEKIEQDGDITRIPLTNTGYVRNLCRESCFKRWRRYHNLMEALYLEMEDYKQLMNVFQGGFTHANAHYVDKILYNVGSHDLTSSYPSVMVLEKFPMSRPKYLPGPIDPIELTRLYPDKLLMFDVDFYWLIPKLFQDHPISYSKCDKLLTRNYTIDNGRIEMAESLRTHITNLDFQTYQAFYQWEKAEATNIYIYDKSYLPKNFVKAILDLYRDKTKLKGDPDEELRYMISKNMTNSAYGMIVTNPLREMYEYRNDMFFPVEANQLEELNKYNKNIRRFIYYPWGVWVTAYARRNLFMGLEALGEDYVYSDTDSLKSLNTELHETFFSEYNKRIFQKIEESSKHFRLPVELYSPETLSHEIKPIGVWEFDGYYEKFKTLGAKRYLTFAHETFKDSDDEVDFILNVPTLTATVAGANKRSTAAYINQTLTPFESFQNDLTIPPEKSGRLCYTYIDNETEGDIVDYMGIPYHYHELSSAHMEPTTYKLSMSGQFIDYLKGVQDFGE